DSPYMPENQKPYMRQNIQRMKENMGELVSLSDDYTQYIIKNDKPQLVVVLIDGECGSTTEHFLFIAKQSKQVTIMGRPTIGMYDYGDMRNFIMPDADLELWCATNRSRRLNSGEGIDNSGIHPDITLNMNQNWIDEAMILLNDYTNRR
ncbi:MAG: S41 family peptidase, partial [Bacteroidota bacterium]